MRLHRIIVPFAIMTILVGALIGAAGCSEDKSDEQVIADALARSLDGYKNHDAEALSWFAEDMDLDELSVFEVDAKEFARTYLEGFDYVIDDVVVEGDTARATVTITCKSYSSYLQTLAQEKEGLSQKGVDKPGSAAERAAMAGDAMLEALRQTETASCSPLVIQYDKIDNTWEPAESSLHDINMTMLSN